MTTTQSLKAVLDHLVFDTDDVRKEHGFLTPTFLANEGGQECMISAPLDLEVIDVERRYGPLECIDSRSSPIRTSVLQVSYDWLSTKVDRRKKKSRSAETHLFLEYLCGVAYDSQAGLGTKYFRNGMVFGCNKHHPELFRIYVRSFLANLVEHGETDSSVDTERWVEMYIRDYVSQVIRTANIAEKYFKKGLVKQISYEMNRLVENPFIIDRIKDELVSAGWSVR